MSSYFKHFSVGGKSFVLVTSLVPFPPRSIDQRTSGEFTLNYQASERLQGQGAKTQENGGTSLEKQQEPRHKARL